MPYPGWLQLNSVQESCVLLNCNREEKIEAITSQRWLALKKKAQQFFLTSKTNSKTSSSIKNHSLWFHIHLLPSLECGIVKFILACSMSAFILVGKYPKIKWQWATYLTCFYLIVKCKPIRDDLGENSVVTHGIFILPVSKISVECDKYFKLNYI